MNTHLAPATTPHCPLCGQTVACAMQQGLPAQSCWCMQLPPLPAHVQAQLEQQAPLQCVCPHCLEQLRNLPTCANCSE